MATNLSPEELHEIRNWPKKAIAIREEHEETLLALASSFGIDKIMLKDPAVRERLETVLGDTLGTGRSWIDNSVMPPSPEPPAIPIANFRKGKRMTGPIHEKFLFDLRDALIGIAGKPGLAMTFEKITGPQDERLVKVADKLNMTGTKAVQFLERHLIHLGISLVGSTGNVYDAVESITVQIALASPIRLQPEILRVTAAQAVPAPELTLYCPSIRTCGYQVSVQDTLAPEVLVKGCPRCKKEELRYELCYADGRPFGDAVHAPSIKTDVQRKWNGDPFQEATPPGKGKVVQHGDNHGWAGHDILNGPTYTTQHAPPAKVVDRPTWSSQDTPPATITGKLNHDGTWTPADAWSGSEASRIAHNKQFYDPLAKD